MNAPLSERQSAVRADLESLRIERDGPALPNTSRPRRRRLLPIALVVVAVAVAVVGLRLVAGRPQPVSVATPTKLAPGEHTTTPVLSGSGYIVTGDRYISLGVRVPGRIDRYFVQEGQSVRKGDPLVQLDDRDYRAAVARAEAGLVVARANRGLAEAEFARGQELRKKAITSQQELDVLQNKAEVARAAVTQVEAQLAQARVDLDYTLLRAPTDGIILAKLKEVGEIAVPGGFAGSGDLIRLANLTDLRAEVDVNEADLNRVRMGQPAEVTPDAYPGAHYAAEVVKLYPQVDRQKGTLKVEVRIPRPDSKLLPDMSVRITFLAPLPPEQAQAPAVLVPLAAVRNDASGSFVWVARDGRARRVKIESAAPAGDRVRVLKGLDGTEAVVVSDDKGLSDGRPVRVE